MRNAGKRVDRGSPKPCAAPRSRRCTKRRDERVAAPDDRDRDARRLEAEQLRLDAGRTADEARGVDPHDADALPGERTLHEPRRERLRRLSRSRPRSPRPATAGPRRARGARRPDAAHPHRQRPGRPAPRASRRRVTRPECSAATRSSPPAPPADRGTRASEGSILRPAPARRSSSRRPRSPPRRGRRRSRHAERLRAPSPSAGLAGRSSASAPFAATRPARTRAPSGDRTPMAAAAAACGRPARALRSPRRADRARRAGGRRAASPAAADRPPSARARRGRRSSPSSPRRRSGRATPSRSRRCRGKGRRRAGAACAARPACAIRSVTEIEGSGTRASGCASSVTQTSSPSKRWPPLARRPRSPPPIRRRSAIGRAASLTHVRAASGASTSPTATG